MSRVGLRAGVALGCVILGALGTTCKSGGSGGSGACGETGNCTLECMGNDCAAGDTCCATLEGPGIYSSRCTAGAACQGSTLPLCGSAWMNAPGSPGMSEGCPAGQTCQMGGPNGSGV